MNPALLATLGTLAETASLKADILPPVSSENAPAFTLPKMAVAAVAERVHSAKTSQQQATRPQENDPVAMQALMACYFRNLPRRIRTRRSRETSQHRRLSSN